jgi:membrane fusion protein (multidrug efflux system)
MFHKVNLILDFIKFFMSVGIRVGRMFVIRFCVFMLSLYSFSLYAAPANKRPPPTVEVQTITRSTIEQDLSALATLKANESVLLKPEVAGRVVTINFNEGQTVSKGQLLVQLDDDLLQAELVSQQANLALTQTEYQRYQALFEQQQVSALDYERKKAELAQAKAALSLVQAKLRQRQVRAPFAGVLGLRQFSVGDVLQANQALVRLNSMSPLKAEIKIPETNNALVSLKQSVLLTLDAVPNLTLKGQITAIEPSLDSTTRALVLRVLIPKTDARVRDGMTARARLLLASNNALFVPEQALVAQKGQFVVFVVKNNIAKAQVVKLGKREVGRVEVLEGLQADDVIVVSGQNKLSKPEMPIKPVPLQGDL